jgi:hypothetical protein
MLVDDLARACHEAQVRHRTTPVEVETVLARLPSSPGAGKLRRILHGDVRLTLSRLEARFLVRLREAGLALPETNRRGTDRRREREARARGDEFRRYTYGDVFDDPRIMLAELRALLSHRRKGRPG